MFTLIRLKWDSCCFCYVLISLKCTIFILSSNKEWDFIIRYFLIIDFCSGFIIEAKIKWKWVHILLDRFVIKIFIVVNIYSLWNLFRIREFNACKLTVLANVWSGTSTIDLLIFGSYSNFWKWCVTLAIILTATRLFFYINGDWLIDLILFWWSVL